MGEQNKENTDTNTNTTNEIINTNTNTNTDMISNAKQQVDNVMNEINLIQDGKSSGTVIRDYAAIGRNFINNNLRKLSEFKQDFSIKQEDIKTFRNKFVAETTILQSAFLLKICKQQPITFVTVSTMLVALPTSC